jgi:DNA-binding SARP family transcriptional activator/TolB-like protein
MAQIRLRAFGGLWIEDSGRALGPASSQPKRLALLALLAGAKPPGLSRDRLLALLWPESDPAHARNALNQAIHTLRRDLLTDAVVEGNTVLRINAAVMSADVAEFDLAHEQGDFQRTLELYTGPLLEGFHLRDLPEFERWADDRRAETRQRALHAARQLAEAAHGGQDLDGAERWVRRALSIDPSDESALRRLLLILRDRGDRAGAVRAYQEFARRLHADLEVEPSPETMKLFETLRAAPDEEPTRPVAEPGQAFDHHEGTATAAPASALPVPPPRPARSWAPWAVAGLAAVGLIAGWQAWRATRPNTPPATDSVAVVAVVPFTSLGPDTSRAYLSAGTTSQVSYYLTRIRGVKVISPAAVAEHLRAKQAIRQMAGELKATAVVSGSVSTSGERLRIEAHVDDPRTGQRLWADSYEGALGEVFATQSEIALSIAQALGRRLSKEERYNVRVRSTDNLEAYTLYLRTNSLLDPVPDLRRVETAQALLRRAVVLDPRYGAAWISLAGTFHWLNYLTGREEWLDSTLAYLEHGMQLGGDPAQPGIADRISSIVYSAMGRHRKALELNRRSLARVPLSFVATSGMAFEYLVLGQADSAYPWVQRALEIRPEALPGHDSKGWVFVTSDSLAAAENYFRETLRLFPDNVYPYATLARFALLQGRPREALSSLREPLNPRSRQHFEGEPKEILTAAAAAALQMGQYHQVEEMYRRLLRIDPPAEDSLGQPSSDEMTCHRAGTNWAFARWAGRRDAGGRRLLDQIRAKDLARIAKGNEEPCYPYEAGAISAALGDTTEALTHLREAATAGWRFYRYAGYDPLFVALRTNPTFKRILAEVADSAAAMRRRIAGMQP